MGCDIEAEAAHAKALDKETKRIIALLKKDGYVNNGICPDGQFELQKKGGVFVIYVEVC
jgi:hypothetical protein